MEDEQVPPSRVPLLQRPTTRRALLAGSAAVAAAGAAATVVGLSLQGGGGTSGSPATSGGAPGGAGAAGAAPGAPQTIAATGPISDPRRRGAHLLRRAGFGGTPTEISEFATLSREEAADRLLDFQDIDDSALNARLQTAGLTDLNTMRPDQANRWWLTRMAYTPRPLEERMTLIWHGLLTSQVSKIGGQRFKLMLIQNELFRKNALPRYDDLLKAIGKDPAMMAYLDTQLSTKEQPNENYARELMELFSMGVGNYTEDDVRESARAFTGWRVSPPPRPMTPLANLTAQERRELQQKSYADWQPQFLVQQRQHDAGSKSFLGRTGNFDGDDIVDIIMGQPATGRYMARRLFTEFANYNPDAATVDRLARVWEASGHQVHDVVRAILVSDEFYSEASYRGFVRSPVEFVVGAMRGLELDLTAAVAGQGRTRRLDGNSFTRMDQVLFEPPSVAGWPGGATWLSSSTFFARVNYLDAVLFPGRRPAPIPVLAAARTPELMVDAALDRLVDGNVSDTARDSLYAYAATVANPEERAAAVAYLVLASPEYQLV